MWSLMAEMLTYKRPHAAKSHVEFCKRFIVPEFGIPDESGNFVREIGTGAETMFSAHHDTVHLTGGRQNIRRVRSKETGHSLVKLHRASKSNCLGADNGAGIYMLLELMRAGVPGVYVIHAEEESGCIGARAMVNDRPDWLDRIKRVISFDRRGVDSVITHMAIGRTCSDLFAHAIAEGLGMGHRLDPGGSITDAMEYADDVPECTNISAGFTSEHTARETLNWTYLDTLRDAACALDWESLPTERRAGDYGRSTWYGRGPIGYSPADDYGFMPKSGLADAEPHAALTELVRDYPRGVATILQAYGHDAYSLAEELGLPAVPAYLWND